jgi:hypothetical protein
MPPPPYFAPSELVSCLRQSARDFGELKIRWCTNLWPVRRTNGAHKKWSTSLSGAQKSYIPYWISGIISALGHLPAFTNMLHNWSSLTH